MTAGRPLRGKTSSGLTSLERLKQLHSLDGSLAYSDKISHSYVGQRCARCVARRQKIQELKEEFNELRKILISNKAVLNIPEETQQTGNLPPEEGLDLVQESAKLRITIDTLMRFQVRRVCRVDSSLLFRR